MRVKEDAYGQFTNAIMWAQWVHVAYYASWLLTGDHTGLLIHILWLAILFAVFTVVCWKDRALARIVGGIVALPLVFASCVPLLPIRAVMLAFLAITASRSLYLSLEDAFYEEEGS